MLVGVTLPDSHKAALHVSHMMQRVVQGMLEQAPDVGSVTTDGKASAPGIRSAVGGQISQFGYVTCQFSSHQVGVCISICSSGRFDQRIAFDGWIARFICVRA